ncbi:hypothetical protein GCM10023185_13700 [Hymenobacter saemangeumensis]|uniref:Uncharacterized protein n=1 Tax=Hymenobacter saemangeumensis TaxID=1084522 RepID=A0ABP8I7X1_9BACT
MPYKEPFSGFIYAIDAGNVLIAGFSAGGRLAALGLPPAPRAGPTASTWPRPGPGAGRCPCTTRLLPDVATFPASIAQKKALEAAGAGRWQW